MNCAIKVENLAVVYKGKNGSSNEAVKNLSFKVSQGEVVGFLGPNGAGKSTTLKALMGFLIPKSGVCEIFGLPAGSREAKQRIGYLPEVAMYYPFLTPLETLTLYGELQGLSGKRLREEATQLLETVGLSKAMSRQNRTLSKGQVQRVGIAQSLLGSPELLILDEVTSGLDPVGRRELRELLLARRDAGCTLFFSSHELSEVDMICDRILILDHGSLIEERKMAELKTELQHYSLTYQGEVPMFGICEALDDLGNGLFRASFRSKAGLLAALERVTECRSSILDVETREETLEDYFVNSLGRAA